MTNRSFDRSFRLLTYHEYTKYLNTAFYTALPYKILNNILILNVPPVLDINVKNCRFVTTCKAHN